jgi:hypothetical protein
MSHVRSVEEMERMRGRFVAGAVRHGQTLEAATRVFDAISKFVGYGFCNYIDNRCTRRVRRGIKVKGGVGRRRSKWGRERSAMGCSPIMREWMR